MCACDSRMRWSSRDSRTGTAARSTSSIALSAPPAPPMKLRFPTPTAQERRKKWCGRAVRSSPLAPRSDLPPVVSATCTCAIYTSIETLLTSASAKRAASKVQHPALSSHTFFPPIGGALPETDGGVSLHVVLPQVAAAMDSAFSRALKCPWSVSYKGQAWPPQSHCCACGFQSNSPPSRFEARPLATHGKRQRKAGFDGRPASLI
jgi:hypothetical protein